MDGPEACAHCGDWRLLRYYQPADAFICGDCEDEESPWSENDEEQP